MAECSDNCDLSYLKIIKAAFEDDNAAIEIIQNHGVLPVTRKCPSVGILRLTEKTDTVLFAKNMLRISGTNVK